MRLDWEHKSRKTPTIRFFWNDRPEIKMKNYIKPRIKPPNEIGGRTTYCKRETKGVNRSISVLISQDANSIGNDVEYKMMIGLSQRWVCKPNRRSQQGRIDHRTYPSARKYSLYLDGIDLKAIKTI